jgi:hypothetical protein
VIKGRDEDEKVRAAVARAGERTGLTDEEIAFQRPARRKRRRDPAHRLSVRFGGAVTVG